jgi:hypothetical protein
VSSSDNDIPRTLLETVFPQEYVGVVYVHLRAAPEAVDNVRVKLAWGPWEKVVQLDHVDAEGIALLFAKHYQDAVPLHLTSSLPLYLSAATGYPGHISLDRWQDHNPGWTRSD